MTIKQRRAGGRGKRRLPGLVVSSRAMKTPTSRPVVLCLSGHDPSGGAGLQADIEALIAQGCHAAPVVTALTVQDTVNVSDFRVLDREWVASVGKLWVRDPSRSSEWRPVWGDSSFQAPIISIMADAGMVVAMSADGGIIEGRAPWRSGKTK